MKLIKVLFLTCLFMLSSLISSFAESNYYKDVNNYIKDSFKGLYVVQITNGNEQYQFWSFDKLYSDKPVYSEYLAQNGVVKKVTEDVGNNTKVIDIFNKYKSQQENVGFNMESGNIKSSRLGYDKENSDLSVIYDEIRKAFGTIGVEMNDFEEPEYVDARYVTYGNVHALVVDYKTKEDKVVYTFSILIRKESKKRG